MAHFDFLFYACALYSCCFFAAVFQTVIRIWDTEIHSKEKCQQNLACVVWQTLETLVS